MSDPDHIPTEHDLTVVAEASDLDAAAYVVVVTDPLDGRAVFASWPHPTLPEAFAHAARCEQDAAHAVADDEPGFRAIVLPVSG